MDKECGKYKVLIAAAGCSRKMKRFKPLLPLGDTCILAQTICRFKEAGMNDIVVVIGYRRAELFPMLKHLGVQAVVNEDYDQTDMLESVKLGLNAMTADTRGILLCPADIPLIEPETIRRLVEAGERADAFAYIPANKGRRGHPLLLGRRIMKEIMNYRGDNGIHGVLEQYAGRIKYIEVTDTNMLMDINRPEDYDRLLKVYEELNRIKQGAQSR